MMATWDQNKNLGVPVGSSPTRSVVVSTGLPENKVQNKSKKEMAAYRACGHSALTAL